MLETVVEMENAEVGETQDLVGVALLLAQVKSPESDVPNSSAKPVTKKSILSLGDCNQIIQDLMKYCVRHSSDFPVVNLSFLNNWEFLFTYCLLSVQVLYIS